MRKIIPLFFAAIISTALYAQTKEKESVSPKSLSDMTINFGSASWNTKSTQVDSAYVFLRDSISGRLAKIVLDETEPDSSIFKGKFSVRWEDLQSVKPEIFVPKYLKLSGQVNVSQFDKMIKSQEVVRKPFLYKKDDNSKQVLEVYDTREQAEAAIKNYKEQLDTEKKSKAVTTDAVLDKAQEAFAREAKRQAELLALQTEAANRESDRIRKEQLEKQKQEARRKELEQQSAEEKRKRKAQALSLADQAIKLYQEGNFLKAEALFKKATEIDPENNAYYFKYGVTLYRLEKFDDAIVKLKIAKVSGTEEIEKNYYLAMLHYRLKEIEPAIEKFEAVKAAKNPTLSPAASFYLGVVQFGIEDFEKAKTNFEAVLDESQDPALDQKAEEYVEKCIQMIAYQKDLKRRHIASVNFGLIYDSNVLFQPDNSTTTSATDKASARFMGGYNYEYRLTKKEKSEMSLKSTGTMMYSAVTSLSTADPYVANATYSYARKGTWGEKTFKFTTEPGYEILHMNLDGTGETEGILGSYVLTNTFMLVSSTGQVGIYNLDFRSEDSLSAVTDDDDDADALRVNLKTTQMFLRDKSMKTAIIAGGGITYNEATGKNKDYLKIDVMAMYTAPLALWLSSWNAGLTAYSQDYSNATTERTDINYGVLAGLGKTWNENTSSSLSVNYGINSSNEETNEYSRYSITLSTTHNF
jgi:tetratricopeptide (TPR) repeat protein